MKKILHLTLKHQWFDMILSGEKKEEYRELKTYWGARFIAKDYWDFDIDGNMVCDNPTWGDFNLKHFDIIRFTNGYSKGAPTFDIECKGISVNNGKPEWGATSDTKYFVLSLGEILTP